MLLPSPSRTVTEGSRCCLLWPFEFSNFEGIFGCVREGLGMHYNAAFGVRARIKKRQPTLGIHALLRMKPRYPLRLFAEEIRCRYLESFSGVRSFGCRCRGCNQPHNRKIKAVRSSTRSPEALL